MLKRCEQQIRHVVTHSEAAQTYNIMRYSQAMVSLAKKPQTERSFQNIPAACTVQNIQAEVWARVRHNHVGTSRQMAWQMHLEIEECI